MKLFQADTDVTGCVRTSAINFSSNEIVLESVNMNNEF